MPSMHPAEEELAELLIVIGHRARIAFEEVCACDQRIGCEVLLLRILGRLGPRTSRGNLAKALGWSRTRATQVVDRLVAKQHIRPIHRAHLTETGANEAEHASSLLSVVGEELLAGVGEDERGALLASLRQVAAKSERLWRITRNAS